MVVFIILNALFTSGLDCKVPGDVVFLLDGSQSINQINWRRQKNFVANLIDNLEVIYLGILNGTY